MASKGINKVILVGNLGQDPETRFLPSGSAVTNISIATSRSWKDKDGNVQEETEWHRVAFFGKLAEIAGEYLKKGSKVYIEGRLKTTKWDDKEGITRYSTQVISDQMQMLDSKGSGNGAGQQNQQQTRSHQVTNVSNQMDSMDNFDDDIPF